MQAAAPLLAAAALSGASDQCTFTIYNETLCSHAPYKNLRQINMAACCQACQVDNQCNAFEFEGGADPEHGSCQLSLVPASSPQTAKGVTCGTRAPLPPPGPAPKVPADFDCSIRRLALQYGKHIMAPIDASHDLYEALQLGPDCGDATPKSPRAAVHVGRYEGGAVHVWLSPDGDDKATGLSKGQPWQTLVRAVEFLASTPAAARPPTTVHLLPGTYNLDSTLELGPEHSGTEGSPVRFVAEEGPQSVSLSGGASLQGAQWVKSDPAALAAAGVAAPGPSVEIWEATLDKGLWAGPSMSTLFAGEQRQIRARWPNGNPEVYCARDLHGGNGCTGYAQTSLKRKTYAKACETCRLGGNVTNLYIHSKGSGQMIYDGTMPPYDKVHNITVETPEAFYSPKVEYSTHQAYEMPAGVRSPAGSFQLDRFDTSITKAFWNTAVPSHMYTESWTPRALAHPELLTVHTYQSEYWGSWSFEVGAIALMEDGECHVSFTKGGFQEARGGPIGGMGGRGVRQDFYIENAFEELDAAREFYFNASTRTLYIATNGSQHPSDMGLVAPRHEVLVRVGGSGSAKEGLKAAVAHITFEGIAFEHTTPSFMQPHEPTAGGDWSVRRSGGVVIEWAKDIAMEGCTFRSLEGNAVLMQHWVRGSRVTGSDFHDIGATPLMLVGSTDGADGTRGTQPWGNTLSRNYVRRWGGWGRQAAGYFEGLAGENTVAYNVFHDGPRAAANFNDGLGGGLVFEGNLLFNVVQDTGEHGSTNAWDRQPLLWYEHGATEGKLQATPAVRQIKKNFVFRNSYRGATSNKWVLDKDDGASNYDENGNVLLYGAIKDRDGLMRMVRNNLMLYPDIMPLHDTTDTHEAMSFQFAGYEWDFFQNNTVYSVEGSIYMCSAAGAFDAKHTSNIAHNRIHLISKDAQFFAGACGPADWSSWQARGFDQGSTLTRDTNSTAAALVDKARSWLPW